MLNGKKLLHKSTIFDTILIRILHKCDPLLILDIYNLN